MFIGTLKFQNFYWTSWTGVMWNVLRGMGEDKYVSMSMISNVVERLEVDSFAGSYFTHSSKIVKIVFRI